MALSYDEIIWILSRQISDITANSAYTEYTYADFVIVRWAGQFFRANYSLNANGVPTVEPIEAWVQVERAWIAPATKSTTSTKSTKSETPMLSTRNAVKKVGDYRIRGYGVVFGGKDLYGETFESDTDFGESRSFIGMPVYYDHALGSIRSQIGEVKAYQFADDGIEFEIELDRRKAYADTLMQLADAGALGMSSGSAQHLVVIDDNKIRRWPLLELSLTPTPAEPRTSALPVKNQPPEASLQALGDSATDEAGDDTYIILED